VSEKIEVFSRENKNFIYIDLSNMQANEEASKILDEAKILIMKYDEYFLHTITNVKNAKFDTVTKEILTEFMKHNKPYIKSGVVIGMDPMKKIFLKSMLLLSGRKNIQIQANSNKEQAIEWVLKQR
jgi:hypothetical protein